MTHVTFRGWPSLAVGVMVTLSVTPCAADKFYYRGPDGKPVELEARLVGSGGGLYLLETADGRYQTVPRNAAQRRERSDGPTPLSATELAARLQKEFTPERFRWHIQEPFLVGLVLASPLPRTSEGPAKTLLKDAAGFLKNVEAAFGRYLRECRLELQPPTHPVVALIFESRDDFLRYATPAGGNRDPSVVRRAAGFYSKVTNILAIRLEECRSFETSLHEAIHQQVYVRGVLQRLAPIPTWFDEGLATGFEANAGKINIGPGKISVRYANQALEATQVKWPDLLTADDAFEKEPLLDDAYGQAWALHWLLVTRYKAEYLAYLRLLGQKKPLEDDSPEQRQADFQKVFGDKLADLQAQFRPALEASVRRQNVVLKPPAPKGLSVTEENLGQVQLSAVRHQGPGPRGARMEVQGTLLNVSPLRPMAFHVTVEADSGMYAEWFVPRLDCNKTTPLTAQNVDKPMRIRADDPTAVPKPDANTFRLRIRSAPADSVEAQHWKAGQLPVPVFGDGRR